MSVAGTGRPCDLRDGGDLVGVGVDDRAATESQQKDQELGNLSDHWDGTRRECGRGSDTRIGHTDRPVGSKRVTLGEVAETVLQRFKDGCSVVHLRLPLRRDVMRLTAHGVCLRTNSCAKKDVSSLMRTVVECSCNVL